MIALVFLLTSCVYAWDSTPGDIPASSTLFDTLTPAATVTPTDMPTPLPTVRLVQGDEALFQGDFAQALVEFQSILNLVTTPDVQLAAQYGLAKTYFLMGDCGSALQIFSNLYTGAYGAPAFYFSGQCYEQAGDYNQAAAAYSSYLQLNPGVIDEYIFELKGDALASNGNYVDAIAAYTSALQATPAGDFDTLNLKICQQYLNQQDYANAIRSCMDLYSITQNNYTKSTANLLAGQAYLALSINDPTYKDQAYARFQDSVTNYWYSYDTYSQLVQLVNDGIPVSDLDRGVIDFNAGQYGLAIDALTRYLGSAPEHAATAHYYRANSYIQSGQYDLAILDYDAIITDHVADSLWTLAWEEKASTIWYYKEQYAAGAQVLLDFVALVPTSEDAGQFLYDAGRIYERGQMLVEAASTWERMINEYPSFETSLRGLFLSAVTYYRMANYDTALTSFQRYFILSTTAEEQAAAQFWIAKCQSAKGDAISASSSWQQSVALDPIGYYGVRASQILNNIQPFTSTEPYDLAYDLQSERLVAGEWLLATFNLPAETDLNTMGELASNISLRRGDAFYELGLYEMADGEFNSLRSSLALDPLNSFRLIPHLLDRNMYQQAIFSSWQILDNANYDFSGSLTAPKYFNHIRFGAYYRELVVSTANNEGFNPLLLFSLIRQESLFEGHVVSSAGAIGLMQIMPGTGEEIAGQLGWPVGYSTSDLYRPAINIPLGARYLARQRDYLGENLPAALASYNAGAGNAEVWLSLSQNDIDMFVEIIRFDETRNYVMQITEFWNIFQMIYERSQQ